MRYVFLIGHGKKKEALESASAMGIGRRNGRLWSVATIRVTCIAGLRVVRQGRGNPIVPVQPASQIDELTAPAAKRPVGGAGPLPRLGAIRRGDGHPSFADWATYLLHRKIRPRTCCFLPGFSSPPYRWLRLYRRSSCFRTSLAWRHS